jgi:hypothetical protein
MIVNTCGLPLYLEHHVSSTSTTAEPVADAHALLGQRNRDGIVADPGAGSSWSRASGRSTGRSNTHREDKHDHGESHFTLSAFRGHSIAGRAGGRVQIHCRTTNRMGSGAMGIKLALILTVICLAGAGLASADDTKQGLREFGWEGTWSLDCSIPNVLKEGMTAVLPRSYDVIPLLGPPIRTVELIYENGPLAGTKSTTIFTIKSARMVTDNKLVTVSTGNTRTVTTESVLSMIDGKMVGLRSVMSGTATEDIQAGTLSVKPWRTGDHFSFVSAENGVALGPDGSPRGSAVLERWKD